MIFFNCALPVELEMWRVHLQRSGCECLSLRLGVFLHHLLRSDVSALDPSGLIHPPWGNYDPDARMSGSSLGHTFRCHHEGHKEPAKRKKCHNQPKLELFPIRLNKYTAQQVDKANETYCNLN